MEPGLRASQYDVVAEMVEMRVQEHDPRPEVPEGRTHFAYVALHEDRQARLYQQPHDMPEGGKPWLHPLFLGRQPNHAQPSSSGLQAIELPLRAERIPQIQHWARGPTVVIGNSPRLVVP